MAIKSTCKLSKVDLTTTWWLEKTFIFGLPICGSLIFWGLLALPLALTVILCGDGLFPVEVGGVVTGDCTLFVIDPLVDTLCRLGSKFRGRVGLLVVTST